MDVRWPLRLSEGLRFRVLLAVVALASIAMSASVLTQSLWRDEAATATAASRSPAALIRMFENADGGLAGYLLFMDIWTHLFGSSELSLRIPSLVAAAATIVAAGILFSRIAGDIAGLTASAFLALHPTFVPFYSVEARPYALGTALATVAALAAHHVSRTGSRRSKVLWAVAASCAIGCHLFVVLAIAPQVLWLLGARGAHRLRSMVVTGAAPATVAIVMVALASRVTALQSWILPVSVRSVAAAGRRMATTGGAVALVGEVPAVWLCRRGRSVFERLGIRARDAAVVLLWAVAPLITLAAYSVIASPALLDRYLLPSEVAIGGAVGIAVAAGVNVLRNCADGRSFVRLTAGVCTLASLTAAVLLAAAASDVRPDDKPEDLRAAAEWILQNQQPGDGIVYAPTWAEAGLRWYLSEWHHDIAPVDVAADESTTAIEAGGLWTPTTDLSTALERIHGLNRVWIAGYLDAREWEPVRDVGNPLAHAIRSCWNRIDERDFGIVVQLWSRPTQGTGPADCP